MKTFLMGFIVLPSLLLAAAAEKESSQEIFTREEIALLTAAADREEADAVYPWMADVCRRLKTTCGNWVCFRDGVIMTCEQKQLAQRGLQPAADYEVSYDRGHDILDILKLEKKGGHCYRSNLFREGKRLTREQVRSLALTRQFERSAYKAALRHSLSLFEDNHAKSEAASEIDSE